ncbi:MAG: mechanosensitive ion channel [Candidatus Omnitrophota bacterium]|nr:mechanosensitive ion channel [Candidatus Omnitrophota bacterium]MDZ4241349.1 mechanosensitive ion channel [Candidatus Omnitrophota bacterium]
MRSRSILRCVFSAAWMSWAGDAFAQAAAEAKSVEEVAAEQIDTAKNLVGLIMEFVVKYSFQVLGGLIVLVAGWMVSRYIANLFGKFLEKKNIDITIAKFLVSGVQFLILSFAVIVALGNFGIQIAPLIAGVSVAGFGLSFAMQGPLSNYAAGATLIFTKPFKVGEIIEVAGVVGEVTDIKLPRTELKTVDGQMIVVPNKHIIGEVIHNYSTAKLLELKVGVSYKADIQKAIDLIGGIIRADARIVNSSKARAGISEFGDSSVNLSARVWCKQDDYWDVLFDTNKGIFDALQKNGVEIPFPQRDVHIYKET